jgi:hypothetical protein
MGASGHLDADAINLASMLYDHVLTNLLLLLLLLLLLSQVNRGAMGASGHLDADAINLEELEAANKQEEAALADMQAPEGTQE